MIFTRNFRLSKPTGLNQSLTFTATATTTVAASSQILHSSTGRDVKAEKSAKEEKSIKGDSEERTIELLRRLLFFLSFSRSLLSISYCRLTGSA